MRDAVRNISTNVQFYVCVCVRVRARARVSLNM